jgi:hypothetical protein
MKKLSVLVGFTLFVLMLMQGFALAQGAKVDLSGFWSLRFEGGGSDHMTLSNTGGSGASGNSSYTGKLVIKNYGEFKIYGSQVPDYFRIGNDVFFGIGDQRSTNFIIFTITGSGTMPGKLTGTGWEEAGIPKFLQGDIFATRQ